jgi:hypothetical protein
MLKSVQPNNKTRSLFRLVVSRRACYQIDLIFSILTSIQGAQEAAGTFYFRPGMTQAATLYLGLEITGSGSKMKVL